jgi:hypothetical protein
MPEQSVFIILLILLGVIGISGIYFAHYRKKRRLSMGKGPDSRPENDGEESSVRNEPDAVPPEEKAPVAQPPSRTPAFATVQKRPWALADLFRALLILLSLVVALGFVMILLPQPAVDEMAMDLRSRYGVPLSERVALLYLGDTIQNGEFRIRGVVRNITAEPLEKLDAAIRFFAHDGTILQTTIVRMSKESIAPDEIAQFNVAYPDYQREFASYAVEFKLRQGDLVQYKDVRGDRLKSD